MTRCFKLGYDDGYANRPARSRSPEYMDGYRSGTDERYHEERYWGNQPEYPSHGLA